MTSTKIYFHSTLSVSSIIAIPSKQKSPLISRQRQRLKKSKLPLSSYFSASSFYPKIQHHLSMPTQ